MALYEDLISYKEGYELAENEFLLKVRQGTGFMTRFNKDGSFPVAFKNWENPGYRYSTTKNPELPIYVVGEIPRAGWKVVKWRFGMSQNWATMIHPLGFTVEIYLDNLLDIMKCNTITNGELMGEFSWKDHKLTKKK